MPVDHIHKQYTLALPDWTLMRETIAGSRAVHEAGIRFLPKLCEQPDPEYRDYNMRAVWYGATGRTAEAFQGMVTRKQPTLETTDEKALEEFLRDCDLQGNSFVSHCQGTLWELIGVARYGTLVDITDSVETTQGRPYVTAYDTEAIVNWRLERVGGEMKYTLVVLKESSSEYHPATGELAPDEYCTPSYLQYRELRLVNNQAIVRVWRPKQKKESEPATDSLAGNDYVLIEERILTRRGKPLDFLPFEFHGLDSNREVPSKPILLDLAHVNGAHYRNSADLENGLHIAGLPTPWAVKFNAPEDPSKPDGKGALPLGTSRAWMSDDDGAQCGFLEFTGNGLKAISEAMADKEKMMAALGARILDDPKRAAETAQSVGLRQTSESNVLTDLVDSAAQSLTNVLRIVEWWIGTAKSPKDLKDTLVTLNKDLLGSKIDPTLLSSLLQAYQSGAMSFKTLFWNLQQGNVYADGTTLEDEQESIADNPPPPPVPLDPNIQVQAELDKKAAADAANQGDKKAKK